MVLLGVVLVYPAATRIWREHTAQRAEQRNFVLASELDQSAIVRGFLLNEQKKALLCSPSGVCPEEPIYFDRMSAVLRTVDSPESPNKYELRAADTGYRLINRADQSLPVPLQELLDRSKHVQTHNPNPMLSGIIYVDEPSELPRLGESDSCTESFSPRLVRIGQAAIHQPGNLAIALVAITYCDGSGGFRIAKFERDKQGWHVVSEQRV